MLCRFYSVPHTHPITSSHEHHALVRRQPSNHLRHLRVSVDPEALVLGHTCQLHVLAIQLFLHDLLQRLEREHFGLRQGKRLVELVLQLCLCALGAGTDGFGVVAVECARGLGVVSISRLAPQYSRFVIMCDIQTRPILIVARNQQRNTKRPAHDALFTLSTLTKPQRQITYRRCAALDPKRLRIVEGVILALDAGVLDHASCIGLQAGHGAANVAVDFDNLLDGGGFEEGGGYALFYAEDYAFASRYLGDCEWDVWWRREGTNAYRC
jgi:hypothetical protein